MPRHEKPGVFDVSKPHKTTPSATSRPVIVGHQPQVSDPMVKDESEKQKEKAGSDSKNIPISFHGDDADKDEDADKKDTEAHSMITEPPKMASGTALEDDEGDDSDDKAFDRQHEKELMAHAQTKKDIEPVNTDIKPQEDNLAKPAAAANDFTAMDTSLAGNKTGLDFLDRPQAPVPQENIATAAFTQPLHISKTRNSGGTASKAVKWTLIAVATIAATAFLAIDTGLVTSNVNLPFHIFNNQKKAETAPAPTPAPVITPPAAPSNVTRYIVPGASVSFSYPNEWGTATTTAEQGYANRGGAAKPTGDYAYLVSFAGNKDIQIAITSSKYLPPARTPLYYDFLKWCTGTNDNKFYRSVLQFSSNGGVETPTTIVCNNGPLADATKLNAATIVQPKTKDADGKTVLGDIYTKNLTNTNLPVFRVKDTASLNAEAIKKLLDTVKAPSQTTSPASPTSQ